VQQVGNQRGWIGKLSAAELEVKLQQLFRVEVTIEGEVLRQKSDALFGAHISRLVAEDAGST